MKPLHTLIILLLTGLFSCDTPDKNHEQIRNNETFKPNQNNKDIALVNHTITDSLSEIQAADTALLRHCKPSKTGIKKEEEALAEIQSVDDPSSYIIPGSIRNFFTGSNGILKFTRVVKNEEDKRVGCSGGGNSLSFTVNTSGKTFLYENEMLKTLNFEYSNEGGNYWENGENPTNGIVKGLLLSENTWQIEINVLIKTRDMFNQEKERHIIVNEIFKQ